MALLAESTAEREIADSTRFLDDLIGPGSLKQVGFRLWDGTLWPDSQTREATLVLHRPGALRAMFGTGTEKALAEAYLRDEFDIEGNIESAFELADRLHDRGRAGTRAALRHLRNLWRLPTAQVDDERFWSIRRMPRHSPESDRRAISFHYDTSNDFFRLWLDQSMVYSCAYFETANCDLDSAQQAKLRHICRKLRLQPGQRLLDIGCGWGGLAIFAARHYGVRVTGVTLSSAQAEWASARVHEAGVSDLVAIELKDYREVEAGSGFDAIVSVGMSEHVGSKMLTSYFRCVWTLLKPGGVFLNHAIGDGVRTRGDRGPSFIQEYVFPDSDTPPLRTIVTAAETAGFEVRDVENLREHYALTLRQWVRRLESSHSQALACVDEKTYRVWRLYMAGSAHGFAHGQLAIYQVLLAKLDPTGDAHLPLTRRDWYCDD